MIDDSLFAMGEFSIANCQPSTAVVLANGDYPRHSIPLQVLREAACVVCCDGAANEYIKRGHSPDAVIGDGDSLLPVYRHLLVCIEEQDDNDLTKAVRYLHARGHSHISIVGATGRREDHTLGNISLLMEYFRAGITACMFTDYGVFIPCRDEAAFSCRVGQQLSIFNFGATGLHAEGLRYPLYDFTNWWQGTLNEATQSTVTFHVTGYYLLFLNYPSF